MYRISRRVSHGTWNEKKGNLLILKVTGELDHCADDLRRRIDREILRT